MKKLHLIICACGLTYVWLYAGAGRAQQNVDTSNAAVVRKDKSAVAQQASKHSVIRSSKPTKQSVTETVDSAAKTNKSLKRIKRNKMSRGQLRRSALKFAEVEVVLNNQFDIEYISSLPRAPGSNLEVLGGSNRVRVQLQASQVNALIKKGANVNVLRKFVLVEGPTGKADRPGGDITTLGSCSGSYCDGSNSEDKDIPDDGYEGAWAYSDIPISGAPGGATVTCIDVHYEITHTYVSDLIVAFSDYAVSDLHVLWYYEGGSGDDISETETGITLFEGVAVNQIWTLWATDDYSGDTGYIDCWWIKVYYEDEGYNYYIQADLYFENTVELWFGFASDPGAVCFSAFPDCGSFAPTCDDPVFEDCYYWTSTKYTPCEDECSSVTVTADPTYGSNQTRKVHLDDRLHIGCCFPQEMCVLTYDAETGEPDQAWVNVTVVPEEAGTADPNSGWSQYDMVSGLYVFCSTYTPTCCYTGRVRVKFRIDNPPLGKDSNDSIIIYSFDQDPIIAPSSDWQTVPDSFCTEGFDFNYYQVYKMYLCANASYDFSLCDNDGVGASCDGDGDLEMFDSSCTSLWYIDGVLSCGYDASTLGTNYEGWSPPSDGYYYLMVSDYLFDQSSYSLAYRGGTLGDFDCSSRVDFADFAILGNQWLQAPGSPPADIAPEVPDNFVNVLDIAAFAENWLEGTAP